MAATVPVSEAHLREWGDQLINPKTPLCERFRALYGLRHASEPLSVDMIGAAFVNPSALLKHELAYVLGQKQSPHAIDILIQVLEDEKQEAIVRHEAGEALGAIGDARALDVLKKNLKNSDVAISQTCELALARIEWSKKPDTGLLVSDLHSSVDPAPPFPDQPVEKLREILVDLKKPLFDRFRAMFTLRNKISESKCHDAKKAAVNALADGFSCKGDDNALFRHEVAYVLGQVAHEEAEGALSDRLKDLDESHMVRHESAEALGNIASDTSIELLKTYLGDKETVVKESCVIALDMTDYHHADEFQYAKTPK